MGKVTFVYCVYVCLFFFFNELTEKLHLWYGGNLNYIQVKGSLDQGQGDKKENGYFEESGYFTTCTST